MAREKNLLVLRRCKLFSLFLEQKYVYGGTNLEFYYWNRDEASQPFCDFPRYWSEAKEAREGQGWNKNSEKGSKSL